MTPALVAVVGAECSGKTSLARALAAALPGELVPEYLRTFVAHSGRAPSAQEQVVVMRRQIEQEQLAAASAHDWVVSDSGALMTAVYSVLYYDDASLIEEALAHHRNGCTATLWCDIDLPWVADAGQRDGPEFRARGHQVLGEIVAASELEVVLVSGTLGQRLDSALGVLRERL